MFQNYSAIQTDSPCTANSVWSSHNRTVRLGDAEIPKLRHEPGRVQRVVHSAYL